MRRGSVGDATLVDANGNAGQGGLPWGGRARWQRACPAFGTRGGHAKCRPVEGPGAHTLSPSDSGLGGLAPAF